MTKPTLTSLCTAATATLTILAALPSELGPLAAIIPAQAKSTIVVIGLIATTILHVLHSGQVQAAAADPASPLPPAPPVPPSIKAVLGVIALCGFVLAIECACATNTGNASKDRAGRVTNAALQIAGDALGRVALSTLASAAQSAANGDKIDLAHAAAQGLWTQSSSIVSSADVQRIVQAWSGNQLDTIAASAAAAYRQAAPATPADRAAVVNTLAQSLSAAAASASAGLP